MPNSRAHRYILALLLAGAASSALAADYWGEPPSPWPAPQSRQYAHEDEAMRVRVEAGMLFLRGDEYVFDGDSTLSQLIWESKLPVLRGSIDVRVGGGFSVRAEGSLAGLGTSSMEDYDWYVPTGNFDDWTHRSQHSDTSVDHFYTGAFSLGYDLVREPDAVVRAHAGLKYTDVQWSAYGGSYIYSVNGFRATVGNFADGTPATTYRQQLPEIFLGVDGEQRYGKLRVGGLLRGGITVFGQSRDNHWMRILLVEDSFRVTPTFTAGLDMGYALGRNAELFVAARYDQAFQMRGKAVYSNTNTGAVTIAQDDIAGAALRGIEVTGGLMGRF